MAEMIEVHEDWQAGKTLAECNKFMLQNEIDCDVTFVVGQKREPVKAHRYMLVSRSSVFQSIFCGSIAHSGDPIPVSDVAADTFRLLLTYIYCDSVNLEEKVVFNLLYAAKKYAVRGLINACFTYLSESMSISNVCSTLEEIHLYNGKSLEEKCFTFIFANASGVLKSAAFCGLCSSCIEKIVRSDELVLEEAEVFTAVIRWAENECKRKDMVVSDSNRREVLGNILYLIRFPLLNSDFFTNHVSTREILNSQEIIGLYQFFHGRDQATNWKFSSCPRRGYSMFTVIRYNLISMEGHDCKGKPQCIAFTCSKPIFFHGVLVYGCLENSATYNVKLDLFEEEIGKKLSQSYTEVSMDKEKHTYEVLLDTPVQLSAKRRYKIVVELDGPMTKIGYHGKADMTSEDVHFHFLETHEGSTSIEKGQIPGILFTFPK